MWKLDFYLLPSNCYNNLDEEGTRRFGEKFDYLKENENLYVPNEFYDIRDVNGVTAADILYGNVQNDSFDYLSEIISKQKMCLDTYDKIREKEEYGYLPMQKADITEDIEHICVDNIKDIEEEKELKVNDVIRIKRIYIALSKDYDLYIRRVSACYPNLIFHQDAFKYVGELGRCAEVAVELSRHLAILNDVGKRLYEYHNKNEKVVLTELQVSYNLECSGKGSKEDISYNKEITFMNRTYVLTCNPHTKLYGKRTNQRIYFCWGRDEIESHNIIIVRIGGHWQE